MRIRINIKLTVNKFPVDYRIYIRKPSIHAYLVLI